ncbi:RDD family protein [Paenibacillus sp. GCM10028914]|uniref:RDD family protein n=1 Tax=Paenibacillus sp. GCM10028914 TaxID=3273416 RepID=UPI0036198B58
MEREAGFWIRLGAQLLDALIVGIPLGILSLSIDGGTDRESVTDILGFLYSLLLPVFWNGYTIGKRICRIRIRKVNDHMPPGFVTMLLRNMVGGLVYAFTFGIGLIASIIMVCVREDKRSLHDYIAGTEVIYDDGY